MRSVWPKISLVLFLTSILFLFQNCSSSFNSNYNLQSEPLKSQLNEASQGASSEGAERSSSGNVDSSENITNINEQNSGQGSIPFTPCSKTKVGKHIPLKNNFSLHGYATRTAFNASSPPTMLYDAGKGRITDLKGASLGLAPFTTESHWDPKSPELMWGVKGGLQSFGSQTVLQDDYIEYYKPPSGFKVRLGPGEGEVEVSESGQRCVVLYEYNQGINQGQERLVSLLLNPDKDETQLLGTLNVTGKNLDKATMSKDCRKILAVYKSSVGLVSYNVDFTDELLLDEGNSSHADVFENAKGAQFIYTLGGADNHLIIDLESGDVIEIPNTAGLDGGHATGASEVKGVIAWSPNTKSEANTPMRLFVIDDQGNTTTNISLGLAESSMSSYSLQPKVSLSPDAQFAIYNSDKLEGVSSWLIPLDHSECQ